MIFTSFSCVTESDSNPLAQGFVQPPSAAQPRVFWWWLESNVSKAAITRDLEEMKRKGIAGAMIFDAGSSAYRSVSRSPAGPTFLGSQWREMFKHAVAEADRLGIEISVNLCSGWDSGGPWVTPEDACQKVVWSETKVQGPRRFSDVLPIPAGGPKNPDGSPVYYRDIAVQALKTLPSHLSSMKVASPKITASSIESEKYPAIQAIDNDLGTFWVSGGTEPGQGPTEERPEWIQLEFEKPFAVSTFFIAPRTNFGPHKCQLQSSENGKKFTTIAQFTMAVDQSKLVTFEEVRSRIFRLLITSAFSYGSTINSVNAQITELELLKTGEKPTLMSGIKHWALKAGYQELRTSCDVLFEQNPGAQREVDVESNSLLDLSEKMDKCGRLVWSVPEGNWTILRVGHTITGMRVSTASPGGHGYMLDFLSAKAMDLQFEAMGEKLLKDAGHWAGKSLKYLHDDSWEVGSPNWSLEFRSDFRKYRGYDLLLYLPVLTDRIVNSREVSNRFLYDFRKTIGDCIAENHYARFRDLCHRNGVEYHAESGGPFWPNIDALKCLGRPDIPMTEFWQNGGYIDGNQNLVGKQAASAAHIYGTKLINAEAFTSIGPHWEEDPFAMKPVADIAFCEGINRFFMHTFTSQPPDGGKPGDEYFAGTHFNPNITWWEQAGAFTDYLSRCQFLLQQGLFVGDVCYYYGDNVPNFTGPKRLDPSLGPGYDYDTTNAEVILTRMSVKNGRIVLPDGMSYHILVLPQREIMPPEVLRKVIELVKAGATVVGLKPSRAPGLRDYPHCDEVVKKLADQLWDTCDGTTIKEHTFGKGRIIWGKMLREILLSDGVKPDFEYRASRNDSHLDFIHRTTGNSDIYFVANRNNHWEQADCTFRVTGKIPELWRPDTGKRARQVVYDAEEGRTTLPLRLAPYGSVFVVFRKPSMDKQVVSIVRNDKSIFPVTQQEVGNIPSVEVLSGKGDSIELRVWQPGKYVLEDSHGKATKLDIETVPAPLEIAGPWVVHFPEGWGAPESKVFDKLISWTQDPEPGIKYFSGTAIYQKSFNIPPELVVEDKHLVLDLGEVKNIAEVTLNGKNLGVLWKKPFRADITDAVKPGPNVLEVEITNLWPNRLIGDQFLPEEERFTRTNVTKFTKESPLLDSGLLGPVQIIQARIKTVK